MKKGFSLVTLLVTIFVIIILTSTVVISANSIYNRALTQDEINHNYMVDKVRFGIK